MKKYAFLFLVFIATLTSCSIEDDDNTQYSVEFMPIESVEVPEYFIYGETYEIAMTYTQPSSCYLFRDFYYSIEGNERTVAIENNVYLSDACVEEPESVTVSFDFNVTGNETYLFKFYQGKDEDGVDQFHLVEVPVIDSRSILED